MDRTVELTEWKPQAIARKHTNVHELNDTVPVRPLRLLHPELVSRMSFDAVLSDAARESGMDDYQIAAHTHMSPGYLSRFNRGVGRQWADRMVRFCLTTRSLGPVQHLADRLGCDLVPRAPQSARIRELEAELRKLQGSEGGLPA